MDFPPEAGKAIPGVLGSISAVLMLRENWRRGLAMLVPSGALSWYGGAFLAGKAGMPEGLAGFLLGLCGMAVVVKALDTWEKLDFASTLRDALRKLLRLPEKDA